MNIPLKAHFSSILFTIQKGLILSAAILPAIKSQTANEINLILLQIPHCSLQKIQLAHFQRLKTILFQ